MSVYFSNGNPLHQLGGGLRDAAQIGLELAEDGARRRSSGHDPQRRALHVEARLLEFPQ